MPQFRFMTQTGTGRPTGEDRKLIRSHVMKGKNKGKFLPLGSRRHAKPASRPDLQVLSPISSDSSGSSNSDLSNDRYASLPSNLASSSPGSDAYTATLECIPRGIGSAASMMDFADSVETATVELVIQFSSIAKQLLFPLEPCVFFDRRVENWITPLAVDAAFLHSKVFTASYYYDTVVKCTTSCVSPRTKYHYQRTIELLRARLLSGDDETRLSNSTLSVVLSLAGQAFIAGALTTAISHLEGIRRTIELRGGLHSLSSNEKLATEILRCDLGIALHDGSVPIFRIGAVPSPSLSSYLPSNFDMDLAACDKAILSMCAIESNDRLATVVITLSKFCGVIDLAATSQRCITVGVLLQTMASTMYDLLDMHFNQGSRDEVIRLGLLCFCTSVFLQWQHLSITYPHLTCTVRKCLSTLTATTPSLPPRLVFWLLVIAKLSVLEDPDSVWVYPMLREAASSCGVTNWHSARDVLRSFMWVDLVACLIWLSVRNDARAYKKYSSDSTRGCGKLSTRQV